MCNARRFGLPGVTAGDQIDLAGVLRVCLEELNWGRSSTERSVRLGEALLEIKVLLLD